MKAAFYEGNKRFRIGESSPQTPAPGQVRLKVAYSGICGTDYHIYLGHMGERVKAPQVIGHEMSGGVVEIGEDVQGFKPGDKVVVRPINPCLKCPACRAENFHVCYNIKVLGVDTPGSFQENWTVPAYTLHRLPDNTDIKLAALIEPLAVAVHDIRLAGVTEKDYVVVLGAGPVGALIALLAKHKGARVLATETNAFRRNLVRELGIEVVNPLETDVAKYVSEQTGTAGADIVFEVTASDAAAEVMTKLVRAHGLIVVVGIFADLTRVDLHQIFAREIRLIGVRLYQPEDFETAISLVATKALPLEPLISDVRPLDQVQAVFEEMETRANFMKVLFKCGD